MTEFKNFAEFIQTAHRHAKHGIRDERLVTKVPAGMSEGTNTEGGYLVSRPIVGPLLMSAQQKSMLWSKAIPLRTSQFGARIPRLAETLREDAMTGKMAYWIGEAGTKTNDYPRMGQAYVQLRKLCVMLPVTDELLADSQLLQDWIDGFVAQRISWVVDRAILYGDPATSMTGIMGPHGGTGVIALPEADPINEATLSSFVNALAPANRAKAEWYMSQENWADMMSNAVTFMNRKELVIDNGRWYLYGFPVNVMEQMKTPGDLVLGDFSQFAVVSMGDAVKDTSIQFKFSTDETWIRWVIRLAGDSFGQRYELEDGSTVATFIVPTGNPISESSSSSTDMSVSDSTPAESGSSSSSSTSTDESASSPKSVSSYSSWSGSSQSQSSASDISSSSKSSKTSTGQSSSSSNHR